MNTFLAVSLLSLGLLLTGCSTANVKYSDLHPFTTASVTDHIVTIHLGADLANSGSWTHPKIKRVEGTIYISGHRSPQQSSRDLVVRLPKRITTQSVVVVWVEPDGSLIPLPLSN